MSKSKHTKILAASLLAGLLFFLLLTQSACEKKEESPGIGPIPSTPEKLKEANKKELERNYKKFNSVEEAQKFFGKEFKAPRFNADLIGVYVSNDKKGVAVLFEDYPPFGIRLEIRKLSKKPDYRKKVEENQALLEKGQVANKLQLVSIGGNEGIAEEPIETDKERNLQSFRTIVWWDDGLEYVLSGKADGVNEPTSIEELKKIAESAY